MKQMAIYATKRGAKKLYLIYPLHQSDDPETMEIRFDIYMDENKKKIPLEIIKVPFAYRESEEETKVMLKEILAKTLQ